MKVRNLQIHRDDENQLKSLAADYEYLGYRVKLSKNKLTVFSLPKKKTQKKKLTAPSRGARIN